MKSTVQKIALCVVSIFVITNAEAFQNPEIGEFADRAPRQTINFSALKNRNEPNLYGFVRNDPVNSIDPFGLWATDVHHQIVKDWLPESYDQKKWRCCKINVRAAIMDGSDATDGDIGLVTLANPGFYGAQSSANAYQHAMKSPKQTVAEAQTQYNQFRSDHLQKARELAAKAQGRRSGAGWDCAFMYGAIKELGVAYHAYSDSLSPAHAGFQTWYGPIDGPNYFVGGLPIYLEYVSAHKNRETMQVYKGMWQSVAGSVKNEFQGTLDDLLKDK